MASGHPNNLFPHDSTQALPKDALTRFQHICLSRPLEPVITTVLPQEQNGLSYNCEGLDEVFSLATNFAVICFYHQLPLATDIPLVLTI